MADEDDDLVQYLSVKRQLLSTYCMNITFYLLLKACVMYWMDCVMRF